MPLFNLILADMMIWIYVSIGVVLLVIAIILFVIFFLKKNKKGPKIKVDEEFMATLIKALGSIDNITDVTVDNGRVKFVLADLDLANLEDAKALSTAGVFVTNNVVKMLFTYDSFTICDNIKSLKRGN